jgi:hypothetical protein
MMSVVGKCFRMLCYENHVPILSHIVYAAFDFRALLLFWTFGEPVCLS